jgi:hypothetical protein
MRILFDHDTPSAIAASLALPEVIEARERGRDRIFNGQLLTAAETAGFNLLLTTDKRIRYQKNLSSRKICHRCIGQLGVANRAAALDRIVDAVNQATPGSYAEVEIPFQ